MKSKISITLCFLFLNVANALAQNTIIFNPGINLGLSVRNASIELTDYPVSRVYPYTGIRYSQIKLTRTKNLIIEINQNIVTRNLFAQVSGSFRYGHLMYDSSKELKRFKSDLFLDILYLFQKKKNSNRSDRVYLFTGMGVGYMNINTKFEYNYLNEYDSVYNPIFVKRVGSFGFLAPRLIIGAKYKRLNGSFILHGTPDDQYEPNPTIWMEFKATYSFFPFNKKRPSHQ